MGIHRHSARDALYLFTPDIMARFVDRASQIDVEIIDDRMLLYSEGYLLTTDPAKWDDLFGLAAAVTAQVDRWARWRDDRVIAAAPAGDASLGERAPSVAEPGRRLKRGRRFSLLAVLVLLAMVGTKLWQEFVR